MHKCLDPLTFPCFPSVAGCKLRPVCLQTRSWLWAWDSLVRVVM